MDDQSLRNTLAILRQIKDAPPSQSALDFINKLAGKKDPRVNIRVAAYLLDQFSQARIVIVNSQLIDEAKSGVLSAISALDHAFSIGSLPASMGNLVNAAPGYIANFVILLSAAGLSIEASNPNEATELADEITEFQKAFDDSNLDPVVRDVAKKQMEALATLLRHVPIFGVEAALTSYFELVSRLRRADADASPEAKAALDPLFKQVKTWGDRLGSIDNAINKGANLPERAQSVGGLLQYLPGLT